jgi:hypothetical protein
MRRGVLERFRREYGALPVRGLKGRHVAAIIASKAKTPDAANNLRKILRHLFEHAIALGMVEHNPVVGVKRLKTKGRGLHCWTDDEIERYRAAAHSNALRWNWRWRRHRAALMSHASGRRIAA